MTTSTSARRPWGVVGRDVQGQGGAVPAQRHDHVGVGDEAHGAAAQVRRRRHAEQAESSGVGKDLARQVLFLVPPAAVRIDLFPAELLDAAEVLAVGVGQQLVEHLPALL
jgi:hypothetical protein